MLNEDKQSSPSGSETYNARESSPNEYASTGGSLIGSSVHSVAQSSREQMLEHGSRFMQFVSSKNAMADMRTMDERAVNEYLRFFYFTLRTRQGGLYSPSSLICIRAGIQRYFEIVLDRRIVLPSNPMYMTSNRMLDQRAQEYSRSGGSVRHYQPILQSDRKLMDDYFNGVGFGPQTSEERLQDEVLFWLIYHFGCGQQQHQQHMLLRLMQRDSIVIAQDQEGREFASLTPVDSLVAATEAARMYDGVAQLKTYLSRLPQRTKDGSLFPKPLGLRPGYSSSVNRGLNYAQNFMRTLSQKAQLSRMYSNHSIRLTRIRDLNSSGHSADQIRAVTGHKCDKSVKRCLRWGDAAVAAAKTEAAPDAVLDVFDDSTSAVDTSPSTPSIDVVDAEVAMINGYGDVDWKLCCN